MKLQEQAAEAHRKGLAEALAAKIHWANERLNDQAASIRQTLIRMGAEENSITINMPILDSEGEPVGHVLALVDGLVFRQSIRDYVRTLYLIRECPDCGEDTAEIVYDLSGLGGLLLAKPFHQCEPKEEEAVASVDERRTIRQKAVEKLLEDNPFIERVNDPGVLAICAELARIRWEMPQGPV